MQIIKQGAVRVHDYRIVYRNDDVACLELDLHSKYAEILGTGQLIRDDITYPVLYFVAGGHTLHLDETQSRDMTTEVCFDEFPNHYFFCMEGPYRYTVCFVLIKKHDVIQ